MGKAKKPALKSLPPTWQEDMWNMASKPEWREARPQLLPALAVLWLTGCRNAEIEHGIQIRCRDDRLRMRIMGAKCVDAAGRERGQPKRYYEFRVGEDADAIAEHPALTYLRSLAALNVVDGVGCAEIKHEADYLYNSIVALGKATFPKLRTRVSPYCFRHQAASDLKADPGVTLEEAAKFMGHLSDYSIGKYGHATHGRRTRGQQIRAVVLQTSRSVKHSRKVDRLARFKIISAEKRQKPKL
ncbi:hypothetical protein B0G57_1291 [Trinickia symbiotica]|uniref:Site-specific integrase n=1 Tax=Trinickia symbiotica TaxID=863227 RepID=A0A2N7WMW3_9BURK|nr:site-specific integrase [Trinickia symbiotica]PMS30763.1 site-specific integrase [Trinickia symbiotica]PPK41459.1 hypothetical protein B0G57_1291 [Trinickia symbiotica]